MEQFRSARPSRATGVAFPGGLTEAHPAQASRRHRLPALGGPRRAPVRLALLDILGRIDPDAGPDDDDLLVQLRVALAAVETRADRLQARYRGWPSSAGLLYARHRE
jgi:hypothetical protein